EGLRLKTLGRVLGQVEAAHGSPPVALSGATVVLKDARGQRVGATAQSDVEGHYEIPSHPPGTYQLCAQAPGFAETCAPEPMVIAADTQYLHFNLTLRPTGGALRGRVLLANGSPCYQRTTAFGTLVAAEVSLTHTRGSVTTTGNHHGEFVLAGLARPDTYVLT